MKSAIEDFVVSTQIVVVIGYSFPYFNRAVDSQLFQTMRKANGLEKVYLQTAKDNLESTKTRLLQRIGKLAERFVVEVRGTDEFFIPDELGET
jgi:hypothetical protein